MDYRCILFIIVTLICNQRIISAAPHSPPLITKEPPTGELLFQVVSRQSENNKPFLIECEAEGEPVPTYRWIKNGKDFKYQTYDDRISQQPGRGTLVIKVPREEDIGQYQCFAENEYGTATSNSVFLRKAELNSFKDEPPVTISTKEGDPFKLNCKPPDGWPKPNVYWVLQDNSGVVKPINNSRMTVDPEGNLHFSNVTKQDQSDESTYACSAVSYFRNEIKVGNKVVLKVDPTGSAQGQNKVPPVQQYVTRRQEVAYRDKTAHLYCIYGGTPLPQTVWSKQGTPLRTSERVSQGNYGKSLMIKHVTAEDEGDYNCEISNGVGEAKSYTINLKVLATPYFIEAPQKQTKAEEETVEFRCTASGTPEPQILWIYNGKPINEAPPNPRRKVSTNSIVIVNLQKSDTGNYGCNATNSLGYVYKDVYVNVLAQAPEFEETPHDEETVDGRTVNMTCRVAGSPRPHIKWMHNGVELTGGRYITKPNGDLEINNVVFGDLGIYTCYAENKLAAINASATLSVKQRTRIRPGAGPIDFEVKAGDQATFRCTAEKDESLDLSIDWKRNGELINFESEPRFFMTNDHSLTITKTTELDSGDYACVASTRLDEDSAHATLIVQDRPNPPRMTNVECYGKEAKVSWKSMGENRAPILNFVVQYNTSFTPDTWEKALDNVPATREDYVIPITPWANYTFRVLARNKIGLSDPSMHFPGMCRTDEDVPYKNPDNVMARGTEPTNLVISWTPMSQIEHHAPHFYYEVFWKRNIPGISWETVKLTNWKQGEYVVNHVPTFQEYVVKVIAYNERGQAKEPAQEVIGYSGEDVPQESPRNLTLIEIMSATSANISWYPVNPDSLRGHFLGYKIQMWPASDSQKSRVQEIQVPRNITNTIINKLTPNTHNLVRVLAHNSKYNSAPSEELSIVTPEGVPDAVQSLDVIPLGSSAFLLSWKPPLETNGVLTGYKIYYQTVHGTELGPLRERTHQINDPNRNQAKLADLEPATNYRISINATTKAGEGKTFYVEKRTRGMSGVAPIKPDFHHYIVETNMYATMRIQWLPCGFEYDCSDKPVGSHFYVKYKMKGEPIFKEQEELNEDFTIIRSLEPNSVYIFAVVSVDGNSQTSSDEREIETYAAATMKPRENMASAGWFVAMVLAIAFLILVLILVCMVKRNRGGKYVVHEREAANGRSDFPEEPGFHEYSQPLGGTTRNRDSFNSEKKPSPESDTDSMAEFAEGDTARFTEDGSFIGQYGQTTSGARKTYGDLQSPSAIATYV